MQKRWIKLLTFFVVVSLFMTLFAGCGGGGKKEETTMQTTTQETGSTEGTSENLPYYEMYDKVEDSSDLPDWTGKQLKLKVWYAHGTGDAVRNIPEHDVVTPEIKRVTGVEIDPDASFDNGGQTIDVKLGMLAAAKDWPDLVFVSHSGMTNFSETIEAGEIYDLTDAINKYAPNLLKKIPFDKFPEVKNFVTNYNQDGNIYAFPMQLGSPERSLKILYPDFVNPNSQDGLDGSPSILIRDDILKMLYPNAKSADEIEALYMEKGTFTKEDIYDVPLKSTEDMIQLLYDIRDLIKSKNLQENGKPLKVTYAFTGQDNWRVFAQLLPQLYRIPSGNNYFTYYDKKTKRVELMFQQDFFKEMARQFNKLVRDGVMDETSLLDNNAAFLEKLNNGQYVVTISEWPDETVLKTAGKTFRYRPLWIDSSLQTDRFIAPISPISVGYGVMIFKESVKEEDLPQIIRFLDYMVSDVGEKMYYWGPRSAGLFEEKDGKRYFKDKELEEAMVYHKDNGKALYYNLTNNWIASSSGYGNAWPYYPTYMWGGSNLAPVFAYEKVRNAADGKNFFNPGNLPGNSYNELGTNLLKDHYIWSFFGIESVDNFWKGRDAFEKALTKTLAAKSDEEFEKLWKEFSDLAVKIGATEKMLKDINDAFIQANTGYLD